MTISRGVDLPAPPWPEHTRAIDLMLGHTLQRLRALETQGHIPVSPNPHGSTGKLTRKQRRTIASIGYRLTAAEIAARYGVCEGTVQNIRKAHGLTSGKQWGNQHAREERNR